MCSLAGIGISLDVHVLRSTMKAALASPIVALISLSVLQSVSTKLPRYVKDCTSSRTSPCRVIRLLFVLLIFIILVLPLLTFNPNVAVVFEYVLSNNQTFEFSKIKKEFDKCS